MWQVIEVAGSPFDSAIGQIFTKAPKQIAVCKDGLRQTDMIP